MYRSAYLARFHQTKNSKIDKFNIPLAILPTATAETECNTQFIFG